jgi:uncharacterized membrane protein HdeD (DUF308 family)
MLHVVTAGQTVKLWVRWLVTGALSILFGIFVLANPVAASFAVTVVAGTLFIVTGAAQIWIGSSAEERWSKIIGFALGGLLLLLGLSLIVNPLQGIVSLATLATVLIAANGVLRLFAAWAMRQTLLFWPMLITGALSVLLAGYIVVNFFEIAPQLLGILLGIELLFNGAGLIAFALFLRRFGQVLDNRNGGGNAR